MYPQGTSSSQMVLRGMDLLLECIASGVYVHLAPHFQPLFGRMGWESFLVLFLPLWGTYQ